MTPSGTFNVFSLLHFSNIDWSTHNLTRMLPCEAACGPIEGGMSLTDRSANRACDVVSRLSAYYLTNRTTQPLHGYTRPKVLLTLMYWATGHECS